MCKKAIPEISIYAIILICILGIWLLQGCSAEGNNTAYRTFQAAKRTFSPQVSALGTIKPQMGAEVRLGARIPGKVEHLYSNIGDYVKKGQVIAELEKAELKANLDKRQAELNKAIINLNALETLGPIEIEQAKIDSSRLQAAYELETIEYNRQETLFKQNLTSRQNLDQTKKELLVAKAELEAISKSLELTRNKLLQDLEQLKAEVETAKATLEIANVELSYATLRAPISGIISSVSTQEGETVAVGLSAPTFVTIIDLDRLQVETFVDEVDIGKIKIGQKASFTVESFPAIDIEGEVVGIYPKAILKENVVFYNVMVRSIKSPPVVLRPEMTANVSIFLESHKDVLVVPSSSIKKADGVNIVYVVENGKPSRRQVQIGWKQDRYIEITSGLNEGEIVLENHGNMEGEEL